MPPTRYFKYRIIPYLKPKKRKPMKPEINKVKDLEAKIKWLEKENEMLITWETLGFERRNIENFY
jgi:hypothetical protein